MVLLVFGRHWLDRWPHPARLLPMFFIVFRIIPFWAIYVVLNQAPRSDVPVFYEAALSAKQGALVYRDFWSPYSPLFAYVTALPLWFWNSAKAVVLLMVLMEGLALWLTWRAYRRPGGEEVRFRLLAYLTLAAPLVFCVLGGQEDIWMWLFGVLSVLVWQQTRDSLWIGVVMALALITTKALAVLIVVPLVFFVDKPVRYIAGLALTGLPALGILVLLVGDKFLTPLAFAGADLPFAPNLWTVLSPLIGDFRPYAKLLSWTGVALTVGVVAWAAILLKARTTYDQALPLLWSLCFCFLMFFHKSSFSNYAFIFLMPLLLQVIDLKSIPQLVALLLFNFAVVVHPTYWWGLGNPIFTRWKDLTTTANMLDYLLELTVVGCLGYFLTLLYRQVRARSYRPFNVPVSSPATSKS